MNNWFFASHDIMGVIKSVAKEVSQKVSSAKTLNLFIPPLAKYFHLLLKALCSRVGSGSVLSLTSRSGVSTNMIKIRVFNLLSASKNNLNKLPSLLNLLLSLEAVRWNYSCFVHTGFVQAMWILVCVSTCPVTELWVLTNLGHSSGPTRWLLSWFLLLC